MEDDFSLILSRRPAEFLCPGGGAAVHNTKKLMIKTSVQC